MPPRGWEVGPPFPVRGHRKPLGGGPTMVYDWSGGPPWAGPMMMMHEPSPRRERLRPPKRSVMNSRLPK
jgi:hypothetical protein